MSSHSEVAPIQFEFQGVMNASGGLVPADLHRLQESLVQATDQACRMDVEQYHAGGPIEPDRQPLDAAYVDLPARLLEEYGSQRESSELGRILSCANRLTDEVDRVLVLGIGGSYMGAKSLMDACCHPYHNELSRAERGGRPRIYFAGNNVDNDHSQALMKMLAGEASDVAQRWAIVVISKSGGTLETAVAFRQFLRLLESSVGAQQVPQLVVPVTGESGKLADLADAIGVSDRFLVPDGVGGRFSILSAVGLLPAAIMGIDIVALLRGAATMTERTLSAEPNFNPAMDYVGICHLLETKQQIHTRALSVWSNALESAGWWYDQLLAESLGKHQQGALPLTVVNTRDLHSRAQQHQEGRRDKLMTNVFVQQCREDAAQVGASDHDQDDLNQIAANTLPDIMNAAAQGTNEAYLVDGRPTANFLLPTLDAATMGQFYQMMMLATSIEGRLIRINPYGQPGVELYKRNMKRILGM